MGRFIKLLRVSTWSPTRISASLKEVLRASVRKHINRIQREIRKSMRLPKHGKTYSYKGRLITASAPGEAPAIRSGRLYANIVPVFSRSGLQASISPRTPYAAYLEYGTKYMKPRPYLKPGFDAHRSEFLSDIKSAIAKMR